jgi:hypothetical protein
METKIIAISFILLLIFIYATSKSEEEHLLYENDTCANIVSHFWKNICNGHHLLINKVLKEGEYDTDIRKKLFNINTFKSNYPNGLNNDEVDNNLQKVLTSLEIDIYHNSNGADYKSNNILTPTDNGLIKKKCCNFNNYKTRRIQCLNRIFVYVAYLQIYAEELPPATKESVLNNLLYYITVYFCLVGIVPGSELLDTDNETTLSTSVLQTKKNNFNAYIDKQYILLSSSYTNNGKTVQYNRTELKNNRQKTDIMKNANRKYIASIMVSVIEIIFGNDKSYYPKGISQSEISQAYILKNWLTETINN